jgi:hypothetical protein
MPIITPILYYATVQDALAPFSAGSETFSCNRCTQTDNTIGATIVQVPHATWTNSRGKAVILMDTVVLGGINGLNN